MAKQPTVGYYRMPWHVGSPALSQDGFPIDHVVLQDDGTSKAVSIDLLDTADERLRRCGIRLACTVQEGAAGWFVWADGWQPWIPTDRRASMSPDAEMPDEVADMVRPFARGATLAPVARVHRIRGRYGLLDRDGRTLAALHDDRITVRRKGENADRARELTVDASGLDAALCHRVLSEIEAVGGVPIAGLSDLFTRIERAVPLPDTPRHLDRTTTVRQFAGTLLGSHLHTLLLAALTVRSCADHDTTPFVERLAAVQSALGALRGVLSGDWCDAQLVLVRRLVGLSPGEVHFRGDLQQLLDGLDAASVSPPLTVDPGARAAVVLAVRVDEAVRILDEAVEQALSEQACATAWAQALADARTVLLRADVARPVLPHGPRTLRVLGKIVVLLAAAQSQTQHPAPNELARLSPGEAFGLGQEVQRSFSASQAAREHFREHWPHRSAQLSKSLGREDTGHR